MNLFLGTLSLAVILAALSPSPTWAAEITRTSKPGSSDDAEDENAGEDIDEGTMTRNQAPPIEDLPDEEARNTLREVLTEQAGLAFAPIVYRGAEILQLQPEFVQGARQGLELIYLRNYAGAMEHFGQMDEEYPGSALGPVGRGLIFQAKMLENFDFDYEPQYETNWRAAKSQLLTAIETPGNEAWEYFLMVGVVGVEAIHATRKYNYVGALSKALEAMRYLERSREEAPDFPDLVLADGINNYWRSVIAMNTKLIPDGEDTRAEGISQMKYVETHGIFLSAPTSLALTFSYLEERDVKRAVAPRSGSTGATRRTSSTTSCWRASTCTCGATLAPRPSATPSSRPTPRTSEPTTTWGWSTLDPSGWTRPSPRWSCTCPTTSSTSTAPPACTASPGSFTARRTTRGRSSSTRMPTRSTSTRAPSDVSRA